MNNQSLIHRIARFLYLGFILAAAVDTFAQAPSLVTKAASQVVPEGGTAVLSMTVAGSLPITYTWRRNFEPTNYYEATLYSTNCTLLMSNMTPDKACRFNIDISNAQGNGPGSQAVVAVMAAGMETNGFALTIWGLTNSFWQIDYTTNVMTAEWINLTNLVPWGPANIKFVDIEATNLNRFYRVIPTVF